MKEYKHTYLTSLPCICLEMLIITAPSALVGDIILCILSKTLPFVIFTGFLAVGLLFMTISLAVTVLTNFIVNAFKRPSAFVDGSTVTYEWTSIELDRIKYITLYLPEMQSRTRITTQELSLYINDSEHIVIKRPSVRLIAYLKKRCKSAKFEIGGIISRLKMDIIIGLCVTVLCVVMAFAMRSWER